MASLVSTLEYFAERPPTTTQERDHLQAVENELSFRPTLPGPGRYTTPSDKGGHVPTKNRTNNGFANLGEFALSARTADAQGGAVDPRLIVNTPTTYGTEQTGADGGYAVPPGFKDEIWQQVAGEGSLLDMTDSYPVSGNSISIPTDEKPPWSSDGVQGYWEPEAAQLKQSKPSLGLNTVRLSKLTALIPVSDELLEDTSSLDGYLRRKVVQIFDYKLKLCHYSRFRCGPAFGLSEFRRPGERGQGFRSGRRYAKLFKHSEYVFQAGPRCR